MASISPTVPQGGGSHKNDRDIVGHSLTSDLVAEGRLNLNPSEVIFVVEIAIASWRRWRSRRRRRRCNRRTEILTVACRVAHDVKLLSPRRRRSGSADCAGDGPPATRWKVGEGGEERRLRKESGSKFGLGKEMRKQIGVEKDEEKPPSSLDSSSHGVKQLLRKSQNCNAQTPAAVLQIKYKVFKFKYKVSLRL
ncbi:hypothetical protein TIFTF001_016584 [Ficus carica]|uniref:Uncharacterized protein n=1 Tax=Ficus carica TaxID=3494 RepID=A0AA88A7Z5_FICCA|nr:hypothetical protein TIFTF001_016584 [Ficus carica]